MYVCGDLNLYLFDEPIDHYKLYETKLEELKKVSYDHDIKEKKLMMHE